jgi:hypothetical protein
VGANTFPATDRYFLAFKGKRYVRQHDSLHAVYGPICIEFVLIILHLLEEEEEEEEKEEKEICSS